MKRALLVLLLLAATSLAAEGALVAHFFATAPTERPNPRGELSPPSSADVTLVALSDVHGRPGVLEDAFEDARAKDAAAILLGGDLADRNGEFEYRWGGTLLALGPPIPTYLAIGNHEGFDRRANLSRERYEKFFGPPVSWFATRGVLVVSIDTADEHSFPEEQARTVEAILAQERPRARAAIILTHVMPRFEAPSIDKRGFVKHLHEPDSARLRALCDRHRVGLVLGGHFHGYATETRGGTLYVMSGGGGGALDGPTERYHFLRVTLRGNVFSHEVVPVDSHHGPQWIRYQLIKYRASTAGALGAATVVLALILRRARRRAVSG